MAPGTRTIPVFGAEITVKTALLTSPTNCAPPLPDPQAPVRWGPLAIAGGIALAGTCFVWTDYGAKFGIYLILGILLGVTLFHSRFGFSSGFQQLVAVGNGQGLRAHALLLGTAASAVMLIAGSGAGLFGAKPAPAAYPLGVALVLGAVLFGMGMQLAGSCASGTLFAVGSGQATIVLTLAGFVTGGTAASWADPVVRWLPSFPGVLLAEHAGWFGAWLSTMAILLAGVLATRIVQWRRDPPPVKPVATAHGLTRLYRGSWPMLTGAVMIGLLAGAVFLVSGGTWGLTGAFPLWGAKILQVFGQHPEQWDYWTNADKAKSVAAPLLTDKTTLTNFGIMIGAALASALAGAWRLYTAVPWRTVAASLSGGLLMGVGAQLAGGCNIGAYLAGISVGSLHGWVWAVCALAGTWLGVRLRPLFRLHTPRPNDSMC